MNDASREWGLGELPARPPTHAFNRLAVLRALEAMAAGNTAGACTALQDLLLLIVQHDSSSPYDSAGRDVAPGAHSA